MSQNQHDEIELVSDEEMEEAGGNCFMMALDVHTEKYLDDEDKGWFIVHGLVQHPETGKYHWHAWNEYEAEYPVPYQAPGEEEIKVRVVKITNVVDKSNGGDLEVPSGMYYNIGKVTCVKRYDTKAAQAMMRKTGHARPWHEYEPGAPE